MRNKTELSKEKIYLLIEIVFVHIILVTVYIEGSGGGSRGGGGGGGGGGAPPPPPASDGGGGGGPPPSPLAPPSPWSPPPCGLSLSAAFLSFSSSSSAVRCARKKMRALLRE